MTIGEFFGTLQESITVEWRKHLQTNKYSAHEALNDFYTEMPKKVDDLIEAYQADNGVVDDYKNLLDEGMDALEYLEALKSIVVEGRKLLGSTELESLTDDILGLIDSTIYKLKHLKESAFSLTGFLQESLGENSLMEAILDDDPVADFDKNIGLWTKLVGLVQAAVDNGSMQNKGSLWKFDKRPDFEQMEEIVKKTKAKKFTKSDRLGNVPHIGFQVMDGKLNCVVFIDYSQRRDKIRPQQSSAVTHGVEIAFSFAKEYDSMNQWTNTKGMRGVRHTAYACPPQVIQQVYDIVKSKY